MNSFTMLSNSLKSYSLRIVTFLLFFGGGALHAKYPGTPEQKALNPLLHELNAEFTTEGLKYEYHAWNEKLSAKTYRIYRWRPSRKTPGWYDLNVSKGSFDDILSALRESEQTHFLEQLNQKYIWGALAPIDSKNSNLSFSQRFEIQGRDTTPMAASNDDSDAENEEQMSPQSSPTPLPRATPSAAPISSSKPTDEAVTPAPRPQPTPMVRPSPTATPVPVTSSNQGLSYGTPVPGKPGYVYSPYEKTKVVDVKGYPPGTEVKCPYTNKNFLVP